MRAGVVALLLVLLVSCGGAASLPATAVPTPIPMLLLPNDTPAPVTAVPTPLPAPTDTPIFIDVGADTQVDPAWYPCREGQIKGNTQSNQLYLPATDRYAVTYRTVVCFDTPAAAEAAGFRLAHR